MRFAISLLEVFSCKATNIIIVRVHQNDT